MIRRSIRSEKNTGKKALRQRSFYVFIVRRFQLNPGRE